MEQNAVAVAVAAAFDISKYELADTAVLTFKDKAGKDDLIGADGKNPAQVRVYSPGSAEGIAAMAKASKATQMRMARLMSGQEAPEDDAELAEQEHAEKLCGFTAEFINFPVKPVDFYSNPGSSTCTSRSRQFIGRYANF
jgi:hypothetical protein